MNPIKALRSELGWTQEDLAAHATVSRMCVLRTEQGLYTDPSDKIMAQLAKHLPTSPVAEYSNLLSAYHQYQRETRISQGSQCLDARGPCLDHACSVHRGRHPMIEWRLFSNVSQVGLCKALCIHPATLSRYESSGYPMPNQILDALVAAGYDRTMLAKLELWTPNA